MVRGREASREGWERRGEEGERGGERGRKPPFGEEVRGGGLGDGGYVSREGKRLRFGD